MLKTRQARHREGISGRKLCVHWFVGAVVTGISGLMLATNAAAESKAVEFNIPAQSVPSALREYARQAAVQLLASTQGLDAVQANAVVGRFDSQTALEMLLAGTGLQAEYRSDATVIVRRVTEASGPLASSMDSEGFSHLVSQTSVEPDRQTADVVNSQTIENSESQYSKEAIRNLEEIVVTGTQIRGAAPVGASMITLDREYIDLMGLATTQEVLQSVPQNFGGGANEAIQTVGFGPSGGNRGFSSSVNLRGLGTESTLLLVNGRRSAPGGSAGSFVDLNSIPAAAIQRVEILPDGASAIYGSDAIGGVVNVILRDNYEGAETRIRYAPGTSDIDETQFSQVFGKRWEGGNVLFTYEYYDRSDLKSEDREYTRDSDLTSLGGSNHSVSISNPGNITRYTLADGTNMNVQFAIPEGQDGTALTPADLLSGVTNLQNSREGTTVLPEQRRNSASILLSQELLRSIDLFGDLRYSSREYENRNNLVISSFDSSGLIDVPSANPFFVDPFGGSTGLRMNYSTVHDYGAPRSSGTVDTVGASLGATLDLRNSWELEVYGSYNTEQTSRRVDRRVNSALLAVALADPDLTTAFNPFGDGSNNNPATLAAVEGFISTQDESELKVLNVRADGDLFETSGGAVKVAIGAQFRDESLRTRRLDFTSTLEPVPITSSTAAFDLERDVIAAFAEVYLPFVTEENDRPGLRNLAASIAARYEDYSDFGDTLNPKLGVSWGPTDSLTFRSTVGTSFRAPLLTELNDPRLFQAFTVSNPASPTGTTIALFRLGSSSDLGPEEGTTWTAGFDIVPTSLPGFSVGLTYFETEIDNLIQVPTTVFGDPIRDPEAFGPIVQHVPNDVDPATVAAIFNEPLCFLCFLFTPDQIEAIVDLRLNNLNKLEVSGLDLDAAYAFDTDADSFSVSLHASHLFGFKEQTTAAAPLEDQLDTVTKPNSLRLRGSLSWQNGGMHAAVFGNHIGDYTADASDACEATQVGFCRVSSWTTWDLNLGYDLSQRYSGFLEGATVSFSVRNVFDTDPPFVDIAGVGVGFDPINANPMGRFLALQLTKEWCPNTSC